MPAGLLALKACATASASAGRRGWFGEECGLAATDETGTSAVVDDKLGLGGADDGEMST